MSPSEIISATSSFSSLAVSASFTLSASPDLSLMKGPSIVSTGAATQPLPGNATLSWVPIPMYSIVSIAVAGLNPFAAMPVVLALPYLSLKPPTWFGYAKIGLPATSSSRNVAVLSFSASPVAFLDLSTVIMPFIQLQSRSDFFTSLETLFAFWTMLLSTSGTPPLTLFVIATSLPSNCLLERFACTFTSICSVGRPSTQTARLLTTVLSSSAEGLYWRFTTLSW